LFHFFSPPFRLLTGGFYRQGGTANNLTQLLEISIMNLKHPNEGRGFFFGILLMGFHLFSFVFGVKALTRVGLASRKNVGQDNDYGL